MKPSTLLQIILRVILLLSVYGTIGALLLGSLAARVIELTMLLLTGKTFGFSWIGFLLGAIFLGVVALTTGARRDQWETFQMIFGGCLSGGLRAAFLGGLVALGMFTFWGDTLTELMMWLEILCGMIVGTLYFTFHPKYAPREEPLILFDENYLKNEKIEWK